jgi:hypothetical protein
MPQLLVGNVEYPYEITILNLDFRTLPAIVHLVLLTIVFTPPKVSPANQRLRLLAARRGEKGDDDQYIGLGGNNSLGASIGFGSSNADVAIHMAISWSPRFQDSKLLDQKMMRTLQHLRLPPLVEATGWPQIRSRIVRNFIRQAKYSLPMRG